MIENQNTQIPSQGFFTHGVCVVKLPDWLDWAIGKKDTTTANHWMVVLPMIQRGSVWKPHQVIDLWDTLLRGMPFGGLMASHIPAAAEGSKVQFFSPLDRRLVTLPPKGGLSLIDGQQRTLAMLIAWPDVGATMNRRIWVDFGEDDKFDHLLRLHVSTESQPFGYQRGGNSGEAVGRLSLAERRRAASTYLDRMNALVDSKESESVKLKYLHDAEITPWHSTLALDLRTLIAHHSNADGVALDAFVQRERLSIALRIRQRIRRIQDKEAPFSSFDEALRDGIVNHLTRQVDAIDRISATDITRRVNVLASGLTNFMQQYFPVIEVPDKMMSAEIDDDTKDPPLAVLFKRIGTGGTDLKTSDYVFSVIKHLNPECHSLVEQQLSNSQIAAIFTPTALVMTAVRLTAAKLGMADFVRLEKPQFTRLLRGDRKIKSGDSNTPTFLPEFSRQIALGGEFVKNLTATLRTIAFKKSNLANEHYQVAMDIGLPKHALTLVQIPALEVILFWLQRHEGSHEVALETSRHQLIRFILYWHLAVVDSEKSSTMCFKLLANEAAGVFHGFPDRTLIQNLVDLELALTICSPDELKQIEHVTHSPADVSGLRGWRRFEVFTEGLTDAARKRRQDAVNLYDRWWNLRGGYSHALLLWLQRDYVFSEFEKDPALPGLDDDTPYDFDHICPQSHWHYWTGKGKGNRLIDFHAETSGPGADNQGHWRLGNAIGNVRVWDSGKNRGDGDAAPSVKLKLISALDDCELLSTSGSGDDSKEVRLRDSAISNRSHQGREDETPAWIGCDPIDGDSMKWSLQRALAFQNAIESRTFNLYQDFYDDLRFSEWKAPATEERPTTDRQGTVAAAIADVVFVSVECRGSSWGGHSSFTSIDSLGALYFLESLTADELLTLQYSNYLGHGFVGTLDPGQRKRLSQYVNANIWDVPEGLCGSQARDALNVDVKIQIGSEEKCWSSEADWGQYEESFQGLIAMLAEYVRAHRAMPAAN